MSLKIFSILILLASHSALAAPLLVTPGNLGSYRVDVDLEFDGRTQRFQLDTGGNSSLVPLDNTTSAYPSIGEAKLEGAAGKPFECDLIRAASVSIEDFAVSNFTFKRCDLGDYGFYNLGLDFFAQAILDINFKDRQLHLPKTIEQDWELYPIIRLEKGHIKIQTKIGGLLSNALFDTGAQITCVDTQFVENHPELFQFIEQKEAGRDVTGHPVYMTFYKLREMQIGELVLKDLHVAAFDFGKLKTYFGENTPMILGVNAMVEAHWILDLGANRWGVR